MLYKFSFFTEIYDIFVRNLLLTSQYFVNTTLYHSKSYFTLPFADLKGGVLSNENPDLWTLSSVYYFIRTNSLKTTFLTNPKDMKIILFTGNLRILNEFYPLNTNYLWLIHQRMGGIISNYVRRRLNKYVTNRGLII